MKSNTFNYSLLAVGIAAVMGVSTGANAAVSGSTDTNVDIINIATANYSVAGVTQPTATSNSVKITVSEQVSFSLVQDNTTTVAPNGFATFTHTLTNDGNRQDNYVISIENRTDDTKQFDITNSTITYRIYTDGATPSPTTGIAGTISSTNNKIPLESNQFAVITVNAKTTDNKGGDTQNLNLKATGTALASNNASVTNIDRSTTTLPTFSIIKTVTNPLDLNDANDIATYKIVVKNPRVTNGAGVDYSAAATNILIEDVLPAGLVVANAITNSTTGAGTTVGTVGQTSTGFTLTNANLAIDGTITIILNVKKGTGTLAAGALNHVKVTDDLDDNANTTNTVVDSTNSADDTNRNFYPVTEENYTNGTVAPGTNGDDSTQPLTTVDRQLSLTQSTSREIAPSTGTGTTSTASGGQVTHQTIITNSGRDIEGDTASELTFTITDNDGETPDAINLVPGTVKISYTPPGSSTAGTPVTISPNSAGVYDIFTALPAGIPNGGKVTISYNVSSDKAVFAADGTSTTKEDTVVTLIPVGDGKPAVNPTITDTTTVKGLTLRKFQALDANCDGSISGTDEVNFTQSPITGAKPDQCVIYRIDAKNTSSTIQTGFSVNSSGFNITDLLISDAKSEFSAGATYVANTAKLIVGAAQTDANEGTPSRPGAVPSIYANVTTLAPQETASLKFLVKIRNDRTTP